MHSVWSPQYARYTHEQERDKLFRRSWGKCDAAIWQSLQTSLPPPHVVKQERVGPQPAGVPQRYWHRASILRAAVFRWFLRKDGWEKLSFPNRCLFGATVLTGCLPCPLTGQTKTPMQQVHYVEINPWICKHPSLLAVQILRFFLHVAFNGVNDDFVPFIHWYFMDQKTDSSLKRKINWLYVMGIIMQENPVYLVVVVYILLCVF